MPSPATGGRHAATVQRRRTAGRCGYGEVDERGLFFTVKRDWTDGAMASLGGRLRLADFGPELVDELKAGRTVRLDDPLTDRRTAGRSLTATRSGLRKSRQAKPA
jgi:hypothetical protein